jgi:hypothetical protein
MDVVTTVISQNLASWLGTTLEHIFLAPTKRSVLIEQPPPPRRKSSGRSRSRSARPAAFQAPSHKTVLDPTFKMVFICVVTITVVSGIAVVWLADHWQSPTQNQQNAFAAADFAWKAGIGAIFGLLGGKKR